jgi:uncharacterized protein (TIGR02145 family)
MLKRNLIRIFVLSTISISLFCCKPEEVFLNGDIKGLVTDATTNEPVQGAFIELIQSYVTADTTHTGNDGTYLLENITPGDYEIQASKYSYSNTKKNVTVVSAKTRELKLTLNGIPTLNLSDTILNFELDLTSIPVTISNIGKGKITYFVITSQDWITIYPSSGEVTDETDTIRVTINKTGLIDNLLYKETIRIISDFGTDTVEIIVNGFMYEDEVYKIVKIGTQIWMAENLKSTKYIDWSPILNVTNNTEWINLTTDAYCWYENNAFSYKAIYGALYNWYTVNTGKLCPSGWHVPSDDEWLTLIDFLGGESVAGGKLKEIGNTHWLPPNTDATNESGFTALPSGNRIGADGRFYNLGSFACFWSSDESSLTQAINRVLVCNETNFRIGYDNKTAGFSVRCLKD